MAGPASTYQAIASRPQQRMLDSPDVLDEVKTRLREIYLKLNPDELLRQIQTRQEALWKPACRTNSEQGA